MQTVALQTDLSCLIKWWKNKWSLSFILETKGIYRDLCCASRIHLVKKVKCTPVQALRLCTGRTAHRGSRGIALPFHDQGTRRGWGVSVTTWPLLIPGKDTLPIFQEACWAPGPVWTDAENLASTGIRSPDRPARSQSLYRLSYRGSHTFRYQTFKIVGNTNIDQEICQVLWACRLQILGTFVEWRPI